MNSRISFGPPRPSSNRSPRTLGRATLLALGSLALSALAAGCTVHTTAKSSGDAASESRSSSSSEAHANATANGSAHGGGNATAHGSGDGDASAKLEGSARGDGKAKVKGSGSKTGIKVSSKVKVDAKRVVFQSKPRVSGLTRAKIAPTFVGVHGSGNLHGSGSIKVKGSASAHGSGSGKANGAANGDKDEAKPSKEITKPAKPTKPAKGEDKKPDPKKTDTKKPAEKPEKPTKKPAKDPATKPGQAETPKTPAPESPKTPIEEAPKEAEPAPLPQPIDPPAEPPENVFGYEEPVRGCFEGLVYFIPGDSTALPKSYDGLESAAALYACEWDIPTRAWEQGFPGLEDRFEWFAIRYTGAFHVSQAGTWKFRISSDDGSRLVIDDKLVIDNDGVHAPAEKSGTVQLSEGDHTMVLEYFQGPRYHINLQLYATPPGGSEGIFSVR